MNADIMELDQAPIEVVATTAAKQMTVIYCNNLSSQVQNALDRAWQTGVVLGYELTQLKATLPHGEFGKLYKSNVNHGLHFSRQAGQKYMTLYKSCLKRAKEQSLDNQLNKLLALRSDDVAPLQDTLSAICPKATSMRQALLALADDSRATYTPTPPINTAGQVRPDPEEELADKIKKNTSIIDLLTERLLVIAYDGTLLFAKTEALADFIDALSATLAKAKNVKP